MGVRYILLYYRYNETFKQSWKCKPSWEFGLTAMFMRMMIRWIWYMPYRPWRCCPLLRRRSVPYWRQDTPHCRHDGPASVYRSCCPYSTPVHPVHRVHTLELYSHTGSCNPTPTTVGYHADRYSHPSRGLHWLGVDGNPTVTARFLRVCVHTLRESRRVGFNVTGILRIWNESPAGIPQCWRT